MMKYSFTAAFLFSLLVLRPVFADDQKPLTEADYYPMITLPLPEDVVLEVGGLEFLDKEKTKLAAATRRGEVWLIENAYAKEPVLEDSPEAESNAANVVKYKRMLFGLHEPLGLLRRPDGIYTAQRSELTRLNDNNGDDLFDAIETICNDWQISGSYHEYAFGPEIGPDGKFWITLNRPFGGEPEGKAHWRGWCMSVDKDGVMKPVCTGLRSPAGIGANSVGDMFYTDNQGDWVPSCKLAHLKPGSYHGNPLALPSMKLPLSNIKDVGESPNGVPLAEAVDLMPKLTLPAVWFPYPQMGKSSSDILLDDTSGKFGPFNGQLFIGDQSTSIITRVVLEKVDGEYQGACIPFRKGFQCGVMRLCWGNDGSLFAGQTNRGWGSSGGKPYGLQRLVWNGQKPFEMHELHAKKDGFEITFTEPVDAKTAGEIASWSAKCWTYKHHSGYGCPPQDTHDIAIESAKVASDGKSVRITLAEMPRAYVIEIHPQGVKSTKGVNVLHPVAYYTLNRIPKS